MRTLTDIGRLARGLERCCLMMHYTSGLVTHTNEHIAQKLRGRKMEHEKAIRCETLTTAPPTRPVIDTNGARVVTLVAAEVSVCV